MANEDQAWWYHERPCIGFLSAAVWQCEGVTLEEWRTDKVTKAGSRKGRCDLYVCRRRRQFFIEAKHTYSDATGRSDRELRSIRRKLKRAVLNSMKPLCYVAVLITTCTVTSCSRRTDEGEESKALREEVKLLRAELERQKAVAPTISTQAVATAARDTSSPELTEFLRVSRRMVSAIGTGVNYRDFGQRLVEVNATAEETLRKLNHSAQRTNIVDFVLALRDAYTLWGYKLSLDSDRMRLKTISGLYVPMDFSAELGDRWNLNFPDLVKKYALDDKHDPPSPIINYGTQRDDSVLIFDWALERIFAYATKTFRELEKLQQ